MSQGESTRVLVADDEAGVRDVLGRVLQNVGYLVEFASDGSETLERIEATRPDLVLLDLVMPVLDGWTVLGRLAGSPHRPPVIVVSAHADCPRALRSGASACLPKPFRFDELLATCARVLLTEGGARKPRTG